MNQVRRHARGRLGVVAAAAGLASLRTLCAGPVPEASPRGVAEALAAEVGGEVDPADVVWETSRGVVLDVLWGRGVVFLARPRGAPRDVARARFSIAPGGQPLRVRAHEWLTATPLADEHTLIGSGVRHAWLTRGAGGEHGAAVLAPPASPASPAMDLGSAVAVGLPIRHVSWVVARAPVGAWRAELAGDALVLAVTSGSDELAAALEPSGDLRVSGVGPELAFVPAPRAPRRDPFAALRGAAPDPPASPDPPLESAVHADAVFPPAEANDAGAMESAATGAGVEWRAMVEPRVEVAGERPPPAPIVRATRRHAGREVDLFAVDLRQLDVRLVPGPAAPAARAGLPGTGTLPKDEVGRVVAHVPFLPFPGAVGAVERRRVIAPPTPSAPGLSESADGALELVVGDDPWSVVEVGEPEDGATPLGLCLPSPRVLVVATGEGDARAAVAEALASLGCAAPRWVRRAGPALSLGLPAASPGDRAPFLGFLRPRRFPQGHPGAFRPSPGRQPEPVFEPAILERSERVLGADVSVTAFLAGRFRWAIRAGTGERSHRMGGAFPESLPEGLASRALAAVNLGIGQRKRPLGLTIDGSTGHRFARRGLLLLASPEGLSLRLSAELREDPPFDATELPATVEAGALTADARRRGLLHERGDLCVLPDGTVLVAQSRFDSHEANAEVLLRAGCSEVAALDRGSDPTASIFRAQPGGAWPETFEGTALIAVDPGHS